MRAFITRSVVGIGVGALAVGVAGPAAADPGSGPCTGFDLVCHMVPVLPDLDHDIDLTKDPDPLTGEPAPLVPPEQLPG